MNELQLIKSKNFGDIQCDFYQDGEDYFLTRDQIGSALEYVEPRKAISDIHGRHKPRLDQFSSVRNLRTVDGKMREVVVYTRKGIMEICRWSQQPKADAFMDFVWETMDDLITGKLNKPLSPAEITLLQAQALVYIERKQNEQQAAIEAVNHRMDTIGDLITLNPNDWRRETQDMLAQIAYALGDIKYVQELRAELYQAMDERFGVCLKTRLTNMKRRMADEGVCKSTREKKTRLDVIAEDKKLIEGYVMLVKEMAIKHGVDKEKVV